MSASLIQVQTISTINSKMVPARDLPSTYGSLATKWLTYDKRTLLATEFSDYWIIQKTTGTSGANYNMYCGQTVPWNNSHFNIPSKLPDLIIIIENSTFLGILIGDVISDLIRMGVFGIFMWITSTSSAGTSSAGTTSASANILSMVQPKPQTLMQFMQQSGGGQKPMAYLQAGNTLIPVPAGGTLQVFPNQFPPMMNISHFRRR